jgi:DNA polymerase III alpha subunit
MWTEDNTQEELVKGVLRHGPAVLDLCQSSADLSKYVDTVVAERLDYPIPKDSINPNNWFIPRAYQEMDIEIFLLENSPESNHPRIIQEIDLYKKHNMILMLKTMKYVVDTLRTNNVVWGVGRGSSVASYVLHIIGVHKIDSVKYNLPIEEFFKGEK